MLVNGCHLVTHLHYPHLTHYCSRRCGGWSCTLRLHLIITQSSQGQEGQKKGLELAVEFYTCAINVSPTEEPVYYSNCGACECIETQCPAIY